MNIIKKNIHIGSNMGVEYCQLRNILLPYETFKIHRQTDLYCILNKIYLCIKKQHHPNYFWKYNELGFSRYRIYHFYNCVSNTSKPWITTAESSFSELRTNNFDPFKYLCRSSCKSIIHLSRWGHDLQLREMDPSIKDIIVPKMRIMHPPQELLVQKANNKDFKCEKVRFILVGNSFYRKGGYECILALEKIRKEGFIFKFDIVGNMFYGDRNLIAFGNERPKSLYKIIERHPQFYTLHGELCNEETLSLIKECDVGLLPSLKERYGFVILEYMAAGLPIITTNQRVFPETNHNSRGWIAEFPVEESIIKWYTPEEKRTASELLSKKLYIIFKEILSNPEQINEKSKNALTYIEENHNPDTFMKKMIEIYEHILI